MISMSDEGILYSIIIESIAQPGQDNGRGERKENWIKGLRIYEDARRRIEVAYRFI